MKFDLFRAYCFDKKGNMRYDRASKWMGLTPSDLYFWHKGHFDLINTATLMSGVFVGYRPTSKSPIFYAPWRFDTCYHSNEDLRRIREIVTKKNTPD
ncbi:MAG: hypothetical protein IJ310_01530 [Clostridia bacterium]|nr:hypothetical protein [Clostridia bacterium]